MSRTNRPTSGGTSMMVARSRGTLVASLLACLLAAGVALGSPSGALQGSNSVLHALSPVSSSDIWAFGYHFQSGGRDLTLAERWNGSSWNIVSTPSPGTGNDFLNEGVAFASNDVWAFGSYTVSGVYHTLTLHWDGSSWSVISSPSPGTGSRYPQGALLRMGWAAAANDVWAVGRDYNGSSFRTLALHWDGSTWTAVSTPN